MGPFQRAKQAGPGAGFVGTIEMGALKSAEIFLDNMQRLSSISVSDSNLNKVTSIQVHEWSSGPIDADWFEPAAECQSLHLLEHGGAIANWDLLAMIFPEAPLVPPGATSLDGEIGEVPSLNDPLS